MKNLEDKNIIKISRIFDSLENFVLSKKNQLSNKAIFQLLGLNSKLSEVYLSFDLLPKEYVNIFIKKIKLFLKNPLFKDLKLNDSKDLEFLGKSQEFKEFIDDIFAEIELKLINKKILVDKYFEPLKPQETIPIQEIQKNTKLDFASLMFILNFMLKNKDIYDFNGRSVILN
jgi:hypothetical protein